VPFDYGRDNQYIRVKKAAPGAAGRGEDM
jgi:hypothetical protein